MADSSSAASTPPQGGFADLKDMIVTAIGDHGQATSDLIGKWGQSQPIDYVKETTECVGRVVKTTAQFLVFWDNIATLIAANRDQPRDYPPPPVGAPGLKAITTVDTEGAANPTVGSGLRRRGDEKESVPASRISVTTSQSHFVLTVDCEGVARGLYEGTLNAADGAGAAKQILYNIYVNPV